MKQRIFTTGNAYFTIPVGSKEKTSERTESLRSNSSALFSEWRTTGDSHYESFVLHPAGNDLIISA